jgi:hypothetical protein
MSEHDNPARYLPVIEKRLTNPNDYNVPTRKANFKRLSNYIRRTQKKRAYGAVVARRLAQAEEFKAQLQGLIPEYDFENVEQTPSRKSVASESEESESSNSTLQSHESNSTRPESSVNSYNSMPPLERVEYEEPRLLPLHPDPPPVPPPLPPPVPPPLPNGFLNFNDETGQVMTVGEMRKLRKERAQKVKDDALLELTLQTQELLTPLEEEHKKCMEQCKALKKQIDKVRQENVYPFELTQTHKLVDLLVHVILNPSTEWKDNIIRLIDIPHDIKGSVRVSGPSYFEAFFQLAFYLGIYADIEKYNRVFKNKDGSDDPNFLYTKSINNQGGGEQGISDITFKLTNTPGRKDTEYACGLIPKKLPELVSDEKTYFISVKRYTKEKSIKNYDIGDLFTYINQEHPELRNNFYLCVCCKDKTEYMKRMNLSRSEYLNMSLNKVYGFMNDQENGNILERFEAFRAQVFSNIGKELITTSDIEGWVAVHYPQHKPALPSLSLHFHQELIVDAVVRRIEEQKREANLNNYICVGVLPRGGKSYIAGGIIHKLKSQSVLDRPFNVLFLTSAINETKSQFEKDLIQKFSDFSDFQFIDLRNADVGSISPDKNKFIFVSRELITGKDKEEDDIIDVNQGFKRIFTRLGLGDDETYPVDLVIFDEAHRGGITDRTKGAFSAHVKGNPPFILMTATYKKLLSEGGFINKVNDLFIWDLEDIEVMKKLPVIGDTLFTEGELNKQIEGFSKFNMFSRYKEEEILKIIRRKLSTGETFESIAKPYVKFPIPYFLSATFSEDVISKLNLHQRGGGRDGFDIADHFKLKDIDKAGLDILCDLGRFDEWHKLLKNKQKAIALLDYITPKQFNADELKKVTEGSDVEYRPEIKDEDKVLSRIFNITAKTMGVNARPAYGTPFSILMFLPTGQKGQQIGRTCRAWGSLMVQSHYWRNNFIIIGLSEFPDKCKSLTVFKSCLDKDRETNQMRPYCSEEKLDGDDLKEKIINLERKALEEGKGLVILTGQRATMGISLPCVDMVFMLDEEEEADIIIQKMYRALTDSPGKRYGFIFDFNIRRIFKAKYEYANMKNMNKFVNKLPLSDLLEQEFQTSLWDSDAWVTKTRTTETFNDFMQQIKDQLFSNLNEIAYGSIVKDIEKEDMKLLGRDIDPTIKAILKGASIMPSQVKSDFQKPGEDAPPAAKGTPKTNDSESGSNNNDSDVNSNKEENNNEMNQKELSKLIEIVPKLTKQFVNLLYLRSSSESGTFDDLLKIYDADKKRYSEKINTNSFNLYSQVLEDLLNFIPVPKMDKDQKTGYLFVGPSTGRKKEIAERQSDWNKIQPGTKFKVKLRDRTEHAIYHPLAKTTTSIWAVKFFGYTVNVFDTVFVETEEGDIKLNDYVRSLPDENDKIDSSIGEKAKRCKILLEFIRSRFKNKDGELNLIYTNYLEAFMLSVKKEARHEDDGDTRYNKIFKVIEKHLVPDLVAKRERGEVFTPPELIREMLFGLKKDKLLSNVSMIWGIDSQGNFIEESEENRVGGIPTELWSNPDLKWLDPASGIGNFPIIAFYKLDHELNKLGGKWKNETFRRKHIIENMLYMIELDKGNAATCKKLFKMILPEAIPNIYNGDTLAITYSELDKIFGINAFDVIMGNPPFNPPKTETGSSGNSIWQNFVIKSYYMLNENGYLCFVHPPGWKKPTDEAFNPENFNDGNHYKEDKGKRTIKQIRQGQVWQVLKEDGMFKFIYTNDQKSKKVGYLDFFPAVDYYVYIKNKDTDKGLCDAKNIFLGSIISSFDIKLNYNLTYLPILITQETQEILHKITSKEGEKTHFKRFRDPKGFSTDSSKGKYKYIYTFDKHSLPKYQYSEKKAENLDMDKVIMNFDGGIDNYSVMFVKKSQQIGSYEMTMYTVVKSESEGKHIVDIFSSNIIKFIFLITQYVSGKMTKNEPLVANSIALSSEEIDNIYDFFKLKKHEHFIEDILAQYATFKAPKEKTRKHKGGRFNIRKTIKNKRF